MEQNTGAKRPAPNRLALVSLLLGISGILSWFYPPLQIIFGASAALTAWLSRRDRRFTGAGIAGFVIGIFCIFLSFFIFFQYMLVYNVFTTSAFPNAAAAAFSSSAPVPSTRTK